MYEEMIAFVRKHFEQNSISNPDIPVKYPFRGRFDHIMRVYHWALRINEVEQGDPEVIAIAAIFHDIGKSEKKDEPHAWTSARLCGEYLEGINFPEDKKNKILDTIRVHSSKQLDETRLTLEQRIMIDADLMDEVGALAVLWDSMAVALGDNPSYFKAYQRHVIIYERLKKNRKYLKTDYGRKLYDERLSVLGDFIKNLEFELGL